MSLFPSFQTSSNFILLLNNRDDTAIMFLEDKSDSRYVQIIVFESSYVRPHCADCFSHNVQL